MKSSVLFLHGRYNPRDIEFYKDLCRNRFLVAVDGGYSFFKLSGIVPDLLIGDFDSLKRMPRDLPAQTAVEKYPPRKDKTDAQLALEFCLERHSPKIDIVQPSFGEADQFIGNVMLLSLPKRLIKAGVRPRVRIVNTGYEAQLIENGKYSITNAKGDLVSVIPLSSKVTYSCRGTEYVVSDVALRPGDTRALRNHVTANRASFDVAGEAFVFRQYGPTRG